MYRDFPEGESVREAQLHRGAAFRAQLLQHDPKARHPLRRIEVPLELGQRLKPLVRRCLVDVDRTGLAAVENRMLLRSSISVICATWEPT